MDNSKTQDKNKRVPRDYSTRQDKSSNVLDGPKAKEHAEIKTYTNGDRGTVSPPKKNVSFIKSISTTDVEKQASNRAADKLESSQPNRGTAGRSISLPNLTGYSTTIFTPQQQQKRDTPHSNAVKLPKLKQTSPKHTLSQLEYEKPLSFQKDLIQPSTRGYIRRASYLAKSLGELYTKRHSLQTSTATQANNGLQRPQNQASFVLHT